MKCIENIYRRKNIHNVKRSIEYFTDTSVKIKYIVIVIPFSCGTIYREIRQGKAVSIDAYYFYTNTHTYHSMIFNERKSRNECQSTFKYFITDALY